MTEVSPLAPVPLDNTVLANEQGSAEAEKTAPWIKRKIADSMTGRVVMSSYESLRAAGTSVVCISAWGDSNPVFLPCIRFRDLMVEAVVAGTGGTAAIAAPAMGPVTEATLSSFGDSILVDAALSIGTEATTTVLDDLIFDNTIESLSPTPSKRLQTTGIKQLTITLKYKHTIEDAQLGFYRSSVHGDSGKGLFSDVKDYFAIAKGWFNPYLFASGRRPIIPRTIKPDIVFCHGPFHGGDYELGTKLLHECTSAINFCETPATDASRTSASSAPSSHHSLFSKLVPHKRPQKHSSPPEGQETVTTSLGSPPRPRRLVILALGIAPHRAGMWTSSARPGESTIRYTLMNGCPGIVVPARIGAPLVAWGGSTLEMLWALKNELPPSQEEGGGAKGAELQGGPNFKMTVNALHEYVDLCTDWTRVVVQGEKKSGTIDSKKLIMRNALALLLIAAICSQDSKEVQKGVDKERSGVVIFRIP